jgi:hypothetical protein
MAVQFSRRDPGKDSMADDTYQPALPQRILDRHGARVLSPSTSVVAAGWAPPRPTVYRSASLLIPEDILRDGEILAVINRVLGEAGLQLVLPPPLARLGEDLLPYLDYLDQLPRAVALRVRPGAPPTEVDSWTGLQRLRAAASGEQPLLPPAVVERISVEHLLASTVTITGTPGSWESSGVGAGDSYVRARVGNRIPVALAAEPPHRHPAAEVPGRRPVIAVVDTGIAPHPWFGIPNRTQAPPAGGFLAVLPGLQQAILTQEEYQANWQPTQFLLDYWDAPVSSEPLIGDVDTDTGHGTFIAGIIRQVTPDATVLAVRVTHSDGVIYEGDVLLALWRLYAQVRYAQQHGDPHQLIDVVSLSLGYFDESPTPGGYTGHLAQVVGHLIHHGVLVVAAAGNDSTTRRFYPAAFASVLTLSIDGGPPVLSVGALNPNGSKALFSNDGSWVHYWATGAAVISTYPVDVQGSEAPDHTEPSPNLPGLPQRRDGLDPDDFSCGFAVWDGTSFAAPLAAAKLAAALLKDAAVDPNLGLAATDRQVMVDRATAASKTIG